MRHKFASFLFISILSGAIFPVLKNNNSKLEDGEFAAPGLVAYAASYSSDSTSEPKYSTQNSKTFQYLNLGNTLNYYRGDSVKVGIIDSGINYDHEDFMVGGSTKVKGDSKYYTYENSSWKPYKASTDGYSYIDDTLGHGTNVAATVAAAINSVGGLGLAPNVELYVYKVTNSSNGYEFGAVQAALTDAKTLKLDVINMSFQSYEKEVSYGGSTMPASSGCSTILSYWLNQAYNAGITLVGAAGNYNTSEPSYPGSNNHVINVGSLNPTGTDKADFSNYGSTIDLVAPGYVHVAGKDSNYHYKDTSGTSFSAPLVTAAIALYKQKNPSATPAQIESALYASCDPIDDSGSDYTNWAGNGALNVAKFLGVDEDGPKEIIINNPEVVNEELELEIGDTFNLDWTVNGVGTFDDSVEFSLFEDNGTISVNSNGTITALAEGEDIVTIQSTADSNVTADIYVTVTSGGGAPTVTSVSVSPASLSLDLNGTKTGSLTATVNGTNNPSQAVTWSSSNTSVATVSALGVVTAKAIGNATITATSQEDQTKSGTCTVTVSDSTVHVTGVSLNKNSTTITVGGSETLSATVSPNNATNKNVTWSSSNTNVATVSNGTISAVATGSSTITVTTVDGSHTATCTVTVEAAPASQTLTITMNSFTDASSSYAWYNWTQTTSDSTSISGKGELYKPDSTKMQFNKSKGNKVAAIFNTTAIPGSITKIEATSQQATIRSWTAYVTSTACSSNGTTLTFGSNKTTVGTCSPAVGTSTSFGTSNAGYSYFCIQEGESSASYISEFKITYTPKSISSIAVKTAPTKTTYEAGDNFDPTGLVITATYSDNTTRDIAYADASSSFSFSPTTSAVLTTSDTSVTITYGEKTCSQAITVTAAKTLSSISISGYTTSFVEGDEFVYGGTVTATFSDSSSVNVTNESTFTGYNMSVAGNYTVTVSYTYKGTIKTQTYIINVAIGTLSSISVSGMTLSYVKNSSFSFDGTCTATFANGYQKTVTPTSVSSPDMTKTGNKTVTVSYTYNGNTRTAEYEISVNAYREVIETTTTSIYCTYDFSSITGSSEITTTTPLQNCYSSTGGITGATVSNNTKTYANAGYIRLATGSAAGNVSFNFGTNNITDVTVVAHGWSDSEVNCTMSITNGGTITTTSSSTNDTFNVHLTAATSSITINSSKNNRICIKSITFYVNTSTSEDIGHGEDCQGLEAFIDEYLHMDYVDNLGYCSDSEHHYYSTAKAAFNNLNDHQRSIFTGNSAYLLEWSRLSAWAAANGDSLNSSTLLAEKRFNIINNFIDDKTSIIVIIGVSALFIAAISGYLLFRKRKEN